MFRVLWIGRGLEEHLVSRRTADVFGRACANYIGQPWVKVAGRFIGYFDDLKPAE